MEVLSGHRIILTHNLFLAQGAGLLSGRPLSLDPVQLPIAKVARELRAKEDTQLCGGFLGLHFYHRHPHSHPPLHTFIPRMLKGVDLAAYEAFFAFGLRCVLKPVDRFKVDGFNHISFANAK